MFDKLKKIINNYYDNKKKKEEQYLTNLKRQASEAKEKIVVLKEIKEAKDTIKELKQLEKENAPPSFLGDLSKMSDNIGKSLNSKSTPINEPSFLEGSGFSKNNKQEPLRINTEGVKSTFEITSPKITQPSINAEKEEHITIKIPTRENKWMKHNQ